MSYKKRGRAGYTGKKEAKTRISKERQFEKGEIKQALQEIEEGEDFRYHYHAKKVLTPEEKKAKHLAWYKRVYGRWTRPNVIKQTERYDGDGWFARHVNHLRSKIKELSGDE